MTEGARQNREGPAVPAGTVALAGFFDLLQLADHPGDLPVYRHFAMTPLAAAKYPLGVPPTAEVAREMGRAFAERGIVGVFRELRALLPTEPSAAWSEYTEACFRATLRAAAAFESSRPPDAKLSAFRG